MAAGSGRCGSRTCRTRRRRAGWQRGLHAGLLEAAAALRLVDLLHHWQRFNTVFGGNYFSSSLRSCSARLNGGGINALAVTPSPPC